MNGNEKQDPEKGDNVEDNSQSQGDGGTSGKQTSSSSSGQQTSSSGGTGTTVSSAETVPTQEAATIPEEGIDADEPAWGVLYPIDRCFYPLDLHDDIYTFGRGSECNYSFDIPTIKRTQQYSTYSKKHFTIKRIKSRSGVFNVLLIDSSMNGVFVNGERLPEKGTRQLCDKDEIALSADKNRVLIYFDKNRDDDPNLPQLFKDKYIMHKIIGNGGFGEVREALSKFGVGRHAVKIINKLKTIFAGKDPEKIDEDVMKEARLLLKLHHPCVIGINDVINSTKYLYIVLELASGGELYQRVTERGQMKESSAKLIFFQMASAVSYLHENNITHRDLKPENILMMSDDEECLIKITDFGVSRLVGETTLMKTQAGTPSYIAPEIIKIFTGQSQEGYTKQVDSWSMGVILYVCLVAYPPFAKDRSDTDQDLIRQILNRNFNFNHERWKNVSDCARSMVSNLLKLDANERLTPKQSLDHEWLKDDDMQAKASSLMASTVVSTPSDNYSMINRIQQNNDDIGSGINIVVQDKEFSNASTKSGHHSGEKRGEKRHLSSDTSNESNQSNGEGDSLHLKEKHFAGTSENEPDTPKLHVPPKFDNK